MTPSIRFGSVLNRLMRFSVALIAISEVVSPSAMERVLIPVWEVIHSSLVSTIAASSSLVMIRGGRYDPIAVIVTFLIFTE